MRFLKEFLTVLLMIAFSMAVPGKVNVTNGDYKLAEVTGNNINIRSGAGTQYPIAYQYVPYSYDVNTATESWTKENVSPAVKGERYWVKDAGDWWEIANSGDSRDSKQFISKKYCKALETDPFNIDSITEPQVYVYTEKGEGMEPGEIITNTTVTTIYPGGAVVTQYNGEYESVLALGIIFENKAIVNVYEAMCYANTYDIAPDAPLDISINTELVPPLVYLNIGEKNMSSFKWKDEDIAYVDITNVSPDEWDPVIDKLKNSDENFKRKDVTDGNNWTTRDDLNKFIRIK